VLSQGLKLLVTVLLARIRQPPPTAASGVPHAEFAAELVSLPSGLLSMVCEAIVKLKVRLGPACVRVRGCRLHGPWERPTRPRRVHSVFQSGVRAEPDWREHSACQSIWFGRWSGREYLQYYL
jgi:hypothetical protein